jgi:hypothetical protein
MRSAFGRGSFGSARAEVAPCRSQALLRRSRRRPPRNGAATPRDAQCLLGRELRLLVGLATPSLRQPRVRTRSPRRRRGAISQSGQSPDIVAVRASARGQGRPAIALTNDPGSPPAADADVVVPLLAGPERAIAATKTYTASLFAIAQLAEVLRPPQSALPPARLDGFVDEQLERAPSSTR